VLICTLEENGDVGTRYGCNEDDDEKDGNQATRFTLFFFPSQDTVQVTVSSPSKVRPGAAFARSMTQLSCSGRRFAF